MKRHTEEPAAAGNMESVGRERMPAAAAAEKPETAERSLGTPEAGNAARRPAEGESRRTAPDGGAKTRREVLRGAETPAPAEEEGLQTVSDRNARSDEQPEGGNGGAVPTGGSAVRRYKFPTWTDFLALAGMYLVIQLVVSMAVMLFGVRMPDLSELESADYAVARQAQEAVAQVNFCTYPLIMGAMIAATLLYRHLRQGNRQFGRYAARGLNPVLILWGIALMVAVNVVLEPLLQLLPPIPDLYGRGVKTMLLTIVLAPIAEEFLCRGILLDAARARGGTVYGLFFSSLFFGVIHFYPAAVVNAFIMGLVLGFIYIRSDSLYIVVILHAFNNALALLLLMFGYGNTTLYELLAANGHRTLYAVVYGVSLAIFFISGYMVWQTISRLRKEEQPAFRTQ